MRIVANGVIVRWEPAGYTVVGWHRHERLVRDWPADNTYSELSYTEMVDVVLSHIDSYHPGDDCRSCQAWFQPSLE